jgi:hypothetical protein
MKEMVVSIKLYDFGCRMIYRCQEDQKDLLVLNVCNRFAEEMNDCNHFYSLSLSKYDEIECPKNKIEIIEEHYYGKFVICKR